MADCTSLLKKRTDELGPVSSNPTLSARIAGWCNDSTGASEVLSMGLIPIPVARYRELSVLDTGPLRKRIARETGWDSISQLSASFEPSSIINR